MEISHVPLALQRGSSGVEDRLLSFCIHGSATLSFAACSLLVIAMIESNHGFNFRTFILAPSTLMPLLLLFAAICLVLAFSKLSRWIAATPSDVTLTFEWRACNLPRLYCSTGVATVSAVKLSEGLQGLLFTTVQSGAVCKPLVRSEIQANWKLVQRGDAHLLIIQPDDPHEDGMINLELTKSLANGELVDVSTRRILLASRDELLRA